MGKQKLVAAIDYGSDSARMILADAGTGITLSEQAMAYTRWANRKFCDGSVQQWRQHPLDYLEVLQELFKRSLSGGELGQEIVGIAFDTTGSTICAMDRNGIPLAMHEEFSDDPDAMFILWKDHTAVEEAAVINDALKSGTTDYTMYQGEYSAEWFWAKILHVIRRNPKIRENAYTWAEHADWISCLLAGRSGPEELVRCSCGAGHKALWNSNFGGLPSREILSSIDGYLGKVYDSYKKPCTAGTSLGTISKEWAEKLGVSENAVISVGSFDAHAGGVGAGIAPGTMVKVIGTSTVDLLIEKEKNLKGKELSDICGMAEDSIIPGYYGIETGQAAFGDNFAWLLNIMLWPLENVCISENPAEIEMIRKIKEKYRIAVLPELEKQVLLSGHSSVTALDWMNGRRYPHLNENVKGAIAGLSLGTTAPELYQAFMNAAVFGSKAIYDALVGAGIEIKRVICVGGIAKKSPYIMQMMANLLSIPIMVCNEGQCCARGAAIYAAVAAGIYSDIHSAQEVFCESYHADYYPANVRNELYQEFYRQYKSLGRYAEFEDT